MKLRASLAELWTRVTKYKTSDKVFTNGDNDQYSKEIERAVNNSATASRAAGTLYNYIRGNGITQDFEFDEHNSLYGAVRDIARDLSKQGGAWVHRSIKLEGDKFVTAQIKVLDYHKCKKGKKDDNNFDGKVLYGDFAKRVEWNIKLDKPKKFYSFSDNQEVIKAQIEADAKGKEYDSLKEALQYYRGQVLYINTTPQYVYALSPFDSVYNDMDTEYRISLYANKMFRSGFLGKTMVMFSGLAEEDSKTLQEDIQGWLGSENSDNVYLAEVENAEDVEKSLFLKQLDSQYDDNMSQNTEKRITRNILGAASNLPEALLFTNDNALFGSSGEMMKELRQFYSQQTADYRRIIEENLQRLGFLTKINPLAEGGSND